VSKQLSCRVQPVYWGALTLDFRHADKYACEIRSPSTAGYGCPSTNVCAFTNQDCPAGARCKLTTRLAWYDADEHFNWMALVESAQDPYYTHPWGGGSTRGVMKGHVSSTASCKTGFEGDRCFATATITALGDGTSLWSGCEAGLFSGAGILGVSRSGSDGIRRIECDADLQIEPTAALTMAAARLNAQIYINALGDLLVRPKINLGPRLARAAATPRPKIAPARLRVSRPGLVTIPLKLNASAKRLMARKKQLAVSMRATFTADGAQPLTRTTRVTLGKPARLPRICRVHRTRERPKRPAHCGTRR
jgi:hypothetical protein